MRKAKLRLLIVCIVVGLFGAVCAQAAPPANDNCADAEQVGNVTNQPFDTTEATFDGTGTCMSSPNIWYCYTATCSGSVTVSLCGSSYDTKVAVYEGCSCDPLGANIACNDDYCGLQSLVTFAATEGHTYLIEVGGYSSYTGLGVISISCVAETSCACCFPYGGCMDLFPGVCAYQGGTPEGEGTSCATYICPQPMGACCDEMTGNCYMSPQEGCAYMWLGPGSDCSMCYPMFGACCLPGGTCLDTSNYDCSMQGGTWQGPGTSCATTICEKPKPPVPHLKWSQPPVEIDPTANPPIYCGWDEPSYYIGGAPPCVVIEDFEDGDIAEYSIPVGDTHIISAAAAHDGSFGLEEPGSGESWIYRDDAAVQVAQGDTISYWVQIRDPETYSRAYCGFGASANGTYSIIAAMNTNELLLQINQNYDYLDIGTSPQTWTLDKWYRMEVEWGVGGSMTGRLYDSDGTTLLNTVTATDNTYTSGGIAFRGFDHVYQDTVERCSSISSATRELMASRLPSSANIAKHNPADAIGWDKYNKAYIFPKAETKVNKLDTIAEIRKQAMSASVNVPVGPQKTNLGEERPVTFKGHILSTNSSSSGSCGSILYAPSEDDDPDYRAAISAACGGATVDYYDARAGTPDVALLSTYDCVHTWANYAYANNVAFGDNLADYVDAGGKVVLGVFCTYTGNHLSGRIMTSGYCPVTSPTGSNHFLLSSYAGDGTTCIHNGITDYNCIFRDYLQLQGSGLQDGSYLDGEIAHAYRPDFKVIYSNGSGCWQIGGGGQWPQLISNACSCGGVAPSKMVADDFRCLGNMPITSIHWWGSYVGWEGYEPPRPQPVAWKIGFWSNVPAAPPCVVVPNACASVEGDAGNAWPFNLAYFGWPSMRYQQIYDEAEVGQSGTITQIRFRPDVDYGDPFGPSSMNVAIYLGYSANPVSSPSPSFANNIGAGYTLVYSGTLTLSSADTGGPPRNFDIVVDVDDKFTYNPSVGPLLLDVYMYTSPSTTFFDADGLISGQTGTTRIYSTGSVSDPCGIVNCSGPTDPPYGLVTMFCFDGATPPMVPASSVTTDVPAADRGPYEPDGVTGAIKGSNPNVAKGKISQLKKQASNVQATLDAIIASSGILKGPIVVTADATGKAGSGGQAATITFTKPEEIAKILTAADIGNSTQSALNVVICGAPSTSTWSDDVQAKLLSTGQFGSVSIINVSTVTPTLAQLQAYDAVLVYSDAYYSDSTALGDVMADYVDAGGGVVCMMFEIGFGESPPNSAQMQGRWDAQGYYAIPRTGQFQDSTATLGTVYDPTHPIMQGVSSFNGGDSSFRPFDSSISTGSTLVADWSDGRPLVVTKTIGGVRRADLGFFPPSSDARSDFWVSSTDGALLMANALTWVAGGPTSRFSYPGKLLWQIVVPADRVDVNNAGRDSFPDKPSDTCFQYHVRLNPNEYFWQGKFEPNTMDNIFWLSIAAVYNNEPYRYEWGWKTRPWHWMDDAVTFRLEGPFEPGITLDPTSNKITPLEGLGGSYDVAFELDTDPNYIKWEQPYTGLRNWDSYTDIFSSAIEYEEGLDIYGMAVDDWLCQRRTPVSSIVWWGSYMGYQYSACQQEQPATPPVKPSYFLISVWTDVPASGASSNCCSAHSWPGCGDPACEASVCSYDPYCCSTMWDGTCANEARSDLNCNCGGSLPYSHPGRKVWEYKAYNYDEGMVGYDKRAPTGTGDDAGPVEPVFRYSVRLPEKDWFCQPDVNAIYWLSIMAVWNANGPISNYSWGWTNHEHVFGDDGVQVWPPEGSDPNSWHWEELIDGQTGESRDLSFMLFTEPNYCCKCANFNVDTIVNFLDFADFADDWLWTGPAGGYITADLNCDGSVDFYDLKIFVDQWLSSCP